MVFKFIKLYKYICYYRSILQETQSGHIRRVASGEGVTIDECSCFMANWPLLYKYTCRLYMYGRPIYFVIDL